MDSEKIAWVVVSLAGNALRYVRTGSRLRPGGSISVRVVLDRATSDIVIDVRQTMAPTSRRRLSDGCSAGTTTRTGPGSAWRWCTTSWSLTVEASRS